MVIRQMEKAPQTDGICRGTEVSREEKAPMFPAETNPEHRLLPYTREISLSRLINKINHINFQDQSLAIIFKHTRYDRTVSLQAHPLPCSDRNLTCCWVEPVDYEHLIESYQLDTLIIAQGQQVLEIKPELRAIGKNQIHFLLPDTCRQTSERRILRHACDRVRAYLFQNSALFHGELIDFCAFQFRIRIRAVPPQTYRWIDPETPVTIVLARDAETLYSGECRILNHDSGKQGCLNLEPVKNTIRRFEPREFRCTRHELMPSPDIIFDHPFFKKHISLKVQDLSGSGFAVEEEESQAVLLPGMIVPQCEILFSDGTSLGCSAQVIYSQAHRESHAGNFLRCGLAFLDMAVDDHIRLLGLLHQVTDAKSYVSNKLDMDALWDFFFEAGFIYPQKYKFLQANKEKIKSTYTKLYNQKPTIATHFTYQERGRIIAHMAMIRFYESSWLIHHHAAIRESYQRGGLMVLNQVGRFINESHRLHSMKMDYVFCYYRPENKFPSQVFGGAARNIRNPQYCSIDLLAYFHHQVLANKETLSPPWFLQTAPEHDFDDLASFYENESGGLMLHCLQLTPEQADNRALIERYRQIGLKRDRKIFALRYKESLCALVLVNLADPGLNMSDLTNSVQFIVTDETYLTSGLIRATVNSLSDLFEHDEIPVLLFPRSTAEKLNMEPEKTYALWVYNTQNLDYYFKFLKRLLKFIQH